MKSKILFSAVLVSFISACSSTEDACEDVTMASEQIQACQLLQKKIVQAKGRPVLRTELERRYEQDCINVRYYRDDKAFAICGNKKKIEKLIDESSK